MGSYIHSGELHARSLGLLEDTQALGMTVVVEEFTYIETLSGSRCKPVAVVANPVLLCKEYSLQPGSNLPHRITLW